VQPATPATTPSHRSRASVARSVELGLIFRLFESEGRTASHDARHARRSHLGCRSLAAARPACDQPANSVSRHLRRCTAIRPHDLFVLAKRASARGPAPQSFARAGRAAGGGTVGQIVGSLRGQTPDGPGEPVRRWQFLALGREATRLVRRGRLAATGTAILLPRRSGIECLWYAACCRSSARAGSVAAAARGAGRTSARPPCGHTSTLERNLTPMSGGRLTIC